MKLEEYQQTWVEREKALDEIKILKDQLYGENLVITEKAHRAPIFEEIVGSSEPLRRVLIQVAKVAPTDSTVLILGETGTGKELSRARFINDRIARNGRSFESTAQRFRNLLLIPNYSDMKRGPSPERRTAVSGGLRRQKAERCSWMR